MTDLDLPLDVTDLSAQVALLRTLARWRDAGWLRSLDVALARFVHELDPQAPASLLLATALAAQWEGRGHSALPLADVAAGTLALAPGRSVPSAVALAGPDDGDVADRTADPCAALAALVARTGWPADEAAARDLWGDRAALAIAPPDDDARLTPLVVAGDLLYLRRYWRHETQVATQVLGRLGAAEPAMPAAAARAWLAALFPPDGKAKAGAEIDWQQAACALALRGRLTLITGGPGTGKTYTAARLLVLLQAAHAQVPPPDAASATAAVATAAPLRVALAAPTGKAAARLRQAISQALQQLQMSLPASVPIADWAAQLGPARTLHALLGAQPGTRRFRHDAAHPLDVDVLFVDEASMVHLEMMAQLLQALPATARIVLLGDKDQLASVEAGAVLGDLCASSEQGGYDAATAQWLVEAAGQRLEAPWRAARDADARALAQQTVALRKSHRFAGPIGQLALAVNRGDGAAALAMLPPLAQDSAPLALVALRDAAALLPLACEGRAGAVGGYGRYLARLAQRPAEDASPERVAEWVRALLRDFDAFRVLCALRDGPWGVSGLNAAIERALVARGALSRRGEWYEGRPVMVTRNEPALGVFNGDVGVVLRGVSAPGAKGAAGSSSDAGLRAWFLDGDALHSVAVGRLTDVETAFAMTVHKSQGSEFEHVALVLPDEDVPVLTRELVYTGITRARTAFTLAAARPALLVPAVQRRTRRVSGLRRLLDRG